MWKNRDDNGNVTLSKNIFSKAIKNWMKIWNMVTGIVQTYL